MGAGGPGVPVLQGRGWESAPSSGPPGHLPPEGKVFLGEPPHSPLKGKAFGRLIAAPTERNPLGRAGEGTRPYGDCGRRTAGAQCAPLQEREREPDPSSAPVCALGHLPPRGEGLGAGGNPRPYTTFTNGSIYKKRDRSGTCPLKHRGETQFRRTFFCLLFFQEK